MYENLLCVYMSMRVPRYESLMGRSCRPSGIVRGSGLVWRFVVRARCGKICCGLVLQKIEGYSEMVLAQSGCVFVDRDE